MSKPARIAVLLALAAFPLLEIGLLIRTGQAIGFWKLALLIIVTAILGTVVIRRVGLAFAGRAVAGLGRSGDGLRPMLSAGLLVISGILLILPGLICDAIGLMLLVPAVRNLVIDSGVIRVINSATVDAEAYTETRSWREAADPMEPTGKTIEGEFERIEENDGPPPTGMSVRPSRNDRDPS